MMSQSNSEMKLVLHLGLYYMVGIVGYVYYLKEFEESIVDTLYFSTAVLTTVRSRSKRSLRRAGLSISSIYFIKTTSGQTGGIW